MHPITSLGVEKESKIEYGKMIGSFLNLTTSRPYIVFIVYLCAQFQSNPREVHLMMSFILGFYFGQFSWAMY